MSNPPWKMFRVGRMDFLKPRWWPKGSDPWGKRWPIQGWSLTRAWLDRSTTALSTNVTWKREREEERRGGGGRVEGEARERAQQGREGGVGDSYRTSELRRR